jgi:KDO2-lipid IV(A) lauroyltransferase
MADEHVPARLTAFGRFYKRSGLRQVVRRRRNALLYHLARVALVPARSVSLPRALAFADRAADIVYSALPNVRRMTLRHLAIAFGDTHSAAAREEIARAAYRNTARIAVELAKFEDIRLHFDEYVSVEGWEHVEPVRDLGRGAIVVTGHIGNFELLAAYFAHRGISVAAGVRRLDDPRLNRLLDDFRTGAGVQTILRSSPDSGREILRVLKRRGIIGLLIDLDIRVPSVSVPFFGRLARTPAAAAVLAVRRDLPVVLTFAQRRPEGGHLFTIRPPIYPPNSGDRQRDIVALTCELSRILEEHIRQHPTEWIWWHRRWRRPPVPGLDLDAERPCPSREAKAWA